MFHVSEGLCFQRINEPTDEAMFYGGVRVIIFKDAKCQGEPKYLKALTAEDWASVVASMTAIGDTSQIFRAVLAMQK